MSLCAVAIDSKAQPCKISVEVGGGTRQQRAFFTAAKPKRDHCPLPVSPTHTMGTAHHSRRTLKPTELCDDEVKDMTSVSHPPPAPTPPPPPPPPTPVTTRLLPPSDGIQVQLGAQAAGSCSLSTSCGFLSGTLCGTRGIITWSVCSSETLCWFLKRDRRGLSVETTAVRFPAC